MTLIEIPNCSHDEFALIRNRILDNIPGALVNDIYVGPRLTAYFMFISEAWVPKALTPFIKPLSPIVKDIDFSDLPIAAINKRPVVLPTLHEGGLVPSKLSVEMNIKANIAAEKTRLKLNDNLELEEISPIPEIAFKKVIEPIKPNSEIDKRLDFEAIHPEVIELDEYEDNMVVTIPKDTKLYTKEELKALQNEPLVKAAIEVKVNELPSKDVPIEEVAKKLIDSEEEEEKTSFTAFDKD